jgi:hypothetical protein
MLVSRDWPCRVDPRKAVYYFGIRSRPRSIGSYSTAALGYDFKADALCFVPIRGTDEGVARQRPRANPHADAGHPQ